MSLLLRLFLLAIWILTDWYAEYFDFFLWPLLGILLAPFSMLCYLLSQIFALASLPAILVLILPGLILDFMHLIRLSQLHPYSWSRSSYRA